MTSVPKNGSFFIHREQLVGECSLWIIFVISQKIARVTQCTAQMYPSTSTEKQHSAVVHTSHNTHRRRSSRLLPAEAAVNLPSLVFPIPYPAGLPLSHSHNHPRVYPTFASRRTHIVLSPHRPRQRPSLSLLSLSSLFPLPPPQSFGSPTTKRRDSWQSFSVATTRGVPTT